MNQSLIFYPVIVQVLLTIGVYFVLAGRKARAIKDGFKGRSETALNNKAWPESVVKASNNIDNQFEVPVLFYVLALVSFSIGSVSLFSLALAWLFALTRCAHVYVHVGKNHVPTRLKLFLIGVLSLIVWSFQILYSLLTA